MHVSPDEACAGWLLIASASHCFEATLYNRYKGSIYLVFDFCEHDLAGLLSNSNVKFTLAEIKKVMQMLLNGLYYIHRNKVQLQPYVSSLYHPIRFTCCLCGLMPLGSYVNLHYSQHISTWV